MKGIFIFLATMGTLAVATQLAAYYLHKIDPKRQRERQKA